ncbi:hypothetical protein B0J13DRAFT_166908 [Dactylonectria estremocensis]|uniref:Stc1 domain-containing protein n=1 Tax=Dactylonectria estremocensis TaxID=1079267 RepID=A0A9P9DJM4_9HYPO|nr:hypothetical protein B0J13DRAFT_166908 [Dactylonectria estremocensis]
MEDDTHQTIRNCRTCKQDLPEVEFRSVKDPTKFTGQCSSCRARQRERIAESRAAVAAMRNIASRLSPRRATKRTDSLAKLTPPRQTPPTTASESRSQPPATPALFRRLAPTLQGLPRPLLGSSTPSAVEGPSPVTPTLSLPTDVLGMPIPQTPVPQGTLPTAPVMLGTPVPQESSTTIIPLLQYRHRVIAAAGIRVKATLTHGHGHSVKSDSLIR